MPTVLLAVVRPPWRTGLVRSTTVGNKQTDTSHKIRQEDIGHCSLLKSAPCVKWDAYLSKTKVYSKLFISLSKTNIVIQFK